MRRQEEDFTGPRGVSRRSLADDPAVVQRGKKYLDENWEGIEAFDTYGMARGVLRAAEDGAAMPFGYVGMQKTGEQ